MLLFTQVPELSGVVKNSYGMAYLRIPEHLLRKVLTALRRDLDTIASL